MLFLFRVERECPVMKKGLRHTKDLTPPKYMPEPRKIISGMKKEACLRRFKTVETTRSNQKGFTSQNNFF